MNFCFAYANKAQLENILPKLFAILHANMSSIAPTGNSYDEDFRAWFSTVSPAMQKSQRQIVLMHDGDILIGYFQYYVNEGTFMMEEIQLRREYHGSGVFAGLYGWLMRQLPDDLETVEAYAHKQNRKSQGVLTHLGLVPIGEGKNGKTYHYRGRYAELRERYR